MPVPVVVFIGAPASGKSKVAKRVSALLNIPRIDTDKIIVAEHGPIVDIFDTQGEPAFRAYERQAAHAALQQHAVVSLGGGAVLNPDTQLELSELPVVLMKVSEEAVKSRIGDPKRPLLRDGIDAWQRLVQERTPIYNRLAKLTIDTSDGDLDAASNTVVAWLHATYDLDGKS